MEHRFTGLVQANRPEHLTGHGQGLEYGCGGQKPKHVHLRERAVFSGIAREEGLAVCRNRRRFDSGEHERWRVLDPRGVVPGNPRQYARGGLGAVASQSGSGLCDVQQPPPR